MPENTIQRRFSGPGLKARRLAAGWTLSGVAARATLYRPTDIVVSRQLISQYENEETAPGAELLAALAGAFGCSIDDLFEPLTPQDAPRI